MPDQISENKYPLLARFTLFYLAILGMILVAASVSGDILSGSPDFKVVIPLFFLVLAANIINDVHLIKRSLVLRNVLNLMINLPAIFFLLSLTGANDTKYWVILIAFAVSWAFFFTTEIYLILVTAVAGCYFILMLYLLKGRMPLMNMIDILAKMGTVIAAGLWVKQLVNLIDKEIDSNNLLLKEKQQKTQLLLSNVVRTIYSALETKDIFIRKHSQRVIEYSLDIADELDLEPAEREKLKTAALLHDIGKMKISDLILKKTERLTKAEMDIVKRHPIDALNILEHIDEFQGILIHIKYHHERWDGSGYPEGLKGETIPLLARILCVANAYDAMTSDRVYQRKLTDEAAIEELKKNSGSQFDPKIVEAFVRKLEKEKSK